MIQTNRLILRQWQHRDSIPLCELNANPKVMRFFPRTLTSQESLAFIERATADIHENGYGIFAVERLQDKQFIGFVGLASPSFQAHFIPCTEILWRLHYPFWGQGYATEAAQAVLDRALNHIGLDKVVSFTAADNTPSIRVMERIGMVPHKKRYFLHPSLEKSHPLCKHVLYQKERRHHERDRHDLENGRAR